MNPNDNNMNGIFYDSNGNPIIINVTSFSMEALPNTNPVPIIKSQEEFSCTVNLTDEGVATLWACCEGLEIIDGGNNNV